MNQAKSMEMALNDEIMPLSVNNIANGTARIWEQASTIFDLTKHLFLNSFPFLSFPFPLNTSFETFSCLILYFLFIEKKRVQLTSQGFASGQLLSTPSLGTAGQRCLGVATLHLDAMEARAVESCRAASGGR